MRKKKKILVVGGTGFIGFHLAKQCIKKKFKVVSFSKNHPRKIRYLKKVKYLQGDISRKKDLDILNEPFDYVVNLGGYVDHKNKIKTFNSHLKGCKNLSNYFLKKKIKSFIQLGSSGEYGSIKSPQKETSQGNPKSFYAKAKFLATSHLLNLYKNYKFPVTILRLYQGYGSKQDINRFIPIVIEACLENKKFDCSNGNQLRDFVHVEDIVVAIIKSIDNKRAKGEIINIGSGKPKKIKNIINFLVNRLKGGKPLFGKIKLRKDEILKIYPDISKANKILKWRPKINFTKGLINTIKHYKNN
ncbi:NAD-dependent epimerase/dehydratase family protein [Pelagibacteraceae bacterium]|nr:NAD-dependent epimerase/dehydratase family protein [Pelagibacteraceae bacterium]MDC0952912.1 NAD-dependent epimerase/dehydratase family protein [Pelagibacteraceae bacterium]